jgi:hypothetical protein
LAVTIIAVWLIARRFAKRQREWDAHMEQERQKHEDFKRQLYESNVIRIDDLSKIKSIGRFEYDGTEFHVVIENGKLTFTDKETGKTYVRT